MNQSVIKALEVLDLLGQAPEGRRLQEIADALGYPQSTTHRLLASLSAKGYVRQGYADAAYHLGWKIVTLARMLENLSRLTRELRPHLEALLRQVQHAINLAVLNGSHVMYLDCLVPDKGLSVSLPSGSLMPIHATSLGKCMLSQMSPDERRALLSQLDLVPFTANTITSLDELLLSIEEVSQLGHAVDNEEFKVGVQCLAVPIVLPESELKLAISMTARTLDLPANWIAQYAPIMLAASEQIVDDLYGIAKFMPET